MCPHYSSLNCFSWHEAFPCWSLYSGVEENPAFQISDQTHKTLHNYKLQFQGKMKPSNILIKIFKHTFLCLSQTQDSNGDLLLQIFNKCLEYSNVAYDSIKKQISVLSAKDRIPECFSHYSLASNNKCDAFGSTA